MVGLFGYLCLLILFKWWTDFGDDDELPGLLNVFLNMFLSPTSFDESTALYSGQHLLQVKNKYLSTNYKTWGQK